ncbi:MAG: serine/threonine protein kinase [Planctomycetota bacterium]|nr:MAG: serine/threonine protein kinase [Planctomycetota bacterium]
MSCPMPRERLWEYAHGELDDARETADICAHVEQCPHCAAQLDEMRSLVADLDDLGDAPPPRALPESIGPYRILRKLGEGGMGVVFEAQQETPRRRVALKVIRGGWIAGELRVRLFQREMQTLARLNHPAIAAIYDAGVTDEGEHYFAMELVEGVCLSDHVAGGEDRPPLRIRQRAELLLEICEAISYAHQRGVIHRDLKPSNILVTPAGRPKILDFGVSRLLDEDDRQTKLSLAGGMVGTLAYMSPEQARGATDEIDVRSDVYALGGVAYELLAGRLAHDVLQRPLHVAVEMICSQPPADPRQFNPSVPRELSAIVLKALEAEPARRYQTAAELADDLRRYLTNHPILARPPSTVYRLRKFVARHTLPVGLLAAIFLIVSASAAGLGALASRLADERNVARREARKFQEINRVLTGFLEAPDPWRRGDRDTRVLDVLDAMARRIESEVGRDPLVAAALRSTLGATYRAFSEYDKAERHLRFAMLQRIKLLGERNTESARSISELGEVLFEMGRLEDARRLIERAYALRRELLPAVHPDIADSLNSLGLLSKLQGDFASAERDLSQALDLRRKLADRAADLPDDRERAERHNALAQTLNNLAALYRAQAATARAAGDAGAWRAALERARPLYAEALELRSKWLGEAHPETAKMHNNYGKLLRDLGERAAAEEHYRASLAILTAALGQRHAYTARAMYNLAELLAEDAEAGDAARRREAETLCAKALTFQQELLAADHPHIRASRALLDRLANEPK